MRISELASGLTQNQEQHSGTPEKTGVSEIVETCGRPSQPFNPAKFVDTDLLAVARRWSQLPLGVRAGIVAMVNATAGGQGKTYRVKSRTAPGLVAVLKLLRNNGSEQARRRLVREVLNLASVQQAGGRVPRVLETNAKLENVPDKSVPFYLVMELIQGRTLSDLVREHVLSLGDAVPAVLALCPTLKIAHAEGVMHRDLKPENLIVRRNGDEWQAHILDYGLSFNEQLDADDNLTRTEESFRNSFMQVPEHMWGPD